MKLHNDDCLKILPTLGDDSIDSIVTDPPAGISFMGKEWDKDKGGRDQWIEWMASVMSECLRVLKPGGHALVWALPRTSHWTATACEDSGFEIRDIVHHLFGSGFPKSLDVSKAIDKMAGVEREVVSISERKGNPVMTMNGNTENLRPYQKKQLEKYGHYVHIETKSATSEAKQWEGWGTGLKPATEHWILCRKPLSEKNVASNVLEHGTGALNIDECRIDLDGDDTSRKLTDPSGWKNTSKQVGRVNNNWQKGRFPANVTHDGSLTFDEARFFYCAKPSKEDKEEGLEERNTHPTVKSTNLMSYLIKLITPKGGTVLDPFMGSGSTGKAAIRHGFNFIGIEMEKEYYDIAKARIEYEQNKERQIDLEELVR